ncbi:hypothetical protein HanOQP8_Chr11g0415571 [Helianthus annuus]|nr:hypothetical protein HanHA89_Chr11g0436821 [Helianthus annuus]KAJ0686413.1 hypothetical protein HanLR1_Chr11g0414481 [Helianthus annuus]KAJ0690234.1 hypothetical protein HanOQP8_Chr11g0415571 [Helianthus annuus]
MKPYKGSDKHQETTSRTMRLKSSCSRVTMLLHQISTSFVWDQIFRNKNRVKVLPVEKPHTIQVVERCIFDHPCCFPCIYLGFCAMSIVHV